MLVLRRRRNLGYIYQERRFAQQIMEWPGMRMTPETTVNFQSPTVVTQGTPQTIFGTPGQEIRANRRASKRNWELSSITDTDRQAVMKREGGVSLKKFKNEKLTAETNYGQKLRNEVLHESRVRNQQGVTNLVTKNKVDKDLQDLNRMYGNDTQKNLEALKKRAHDKKYMEQRRKEMEQRRLESAKKIEQSKQQQPKPQQPVQPKPQQPVQPKPTGSSTAFPSDLKNLPQQTPSIPSSPVLDSTITNNNSALTGLSNDLKNTTPQTSKTGGGSGSGSTGGGSSASTGATKTGAAAETASQQAAKKGVKFRTTAGRYALGGAATLGAGYLLYNHFKNKDKK